MDLRRRMELLADSALADREGVPRLRRPSRLAGPAPVGKNPLASVGIAAVRLPGAEPAQVEEAARLANRISVNLEGPSDDHVHRLTRDKSFSGDLLPKLEHAGRLLAARRGSPGALPSSGTTTQFVVGAAGERDREILTVVDRLERRRLLHPAHFSAFQPVAGP